MFEVLSNCFKESERLSHIQNQTLPESTPSVYQDNYASYASSAGIAIEAAVVVVPFTKFLPLISEIGNIFNEVIEITQAAEHNKRTCDALLRRVYAADLAVIDLKIQRNR